MTTPHQSRPDDDGARLSEKPDPEQSSEEHDRMAQPVDREEPPRLPFPVVGIGASAGGLEAALEFFSAMRSDSGMAFVLVQHLPPDRATLMDEILSKKTAMAVCQVADGMPVEADHVYVIRPGRTLTIKDGAFHLGESLAKPMHKRPIDDFFKSLAEEQRQRAIAIIMSGMGSNGAAGAQAIKAVGGLCIAQDPESAQFPSMPRHLIDAGYADYILAPRDMPGKLLDYAGHPYAREDPGSAEAALRRDQQHIREILAILRTRTRHDFSGYKKPTLLRRIQRRMGLARVTELRDYAKILRQTPTEASALADDLLIHVTGFFRDAEAWEALRAKVIVPLVEAREPNTTIRAWVAACSSGEEAYTLAMLLTEEIDRAKKPLDIQIFATDTADRTLQNARHGVYPGGIESEIAPERLERFFKRDDATYRIRPEIRERVVFAPQNVLHDPPFSRLDIVTCRNLLIYLEPDLQQRVINLLHFGLREGGALFLGTSETVTGAADSFATIDKKARIYRRLGRTRYGTVEFPLPASTRPVPDRPPVSRPSVEQLTNRALLEHHTPAAVTIDREYRILNFHGETAPFVSQPGGEPTRDLMALLHGALRGAVRTAVETAEAKRVPVSIQRVWVEQKDGTRGQLVVTVSPIRTNDETDQFVVSFRRLDEPRAEPAGGPDKEPEILIGESADDFRRIRDELQSTIEELQTSNEELKATHEEVMSTNEELQSTNEELETSREEMQSLNEELSTVNSQLQAKIEEHQGLSNDLTSLLTSTDIAVLFLDTRFRIRRFTPQVKELLDMIATDVGRPLSDLARKFDDPQLLPEAAQVLDRLVPVEREISAEGGRWFLRRITPYRTADNRIDGVVVAFVEITARRRAEDAVRQSEEQFRQSLQQAPVPIIMQAENGEVLLVNSAWTELAGYRREDIPVMDAWLGTIGHDEAALLRARLHDLFQGTIRTLTADFVMRTRAGDSRHWSFTASSPGTLAGGRRFIVGMAVDITAEAQLQASKHAVEAASAMKDQFLANVSHELRTPLSVVLMWSKLLAAGGMSEADQREAVAAIARSAEAQRRLIDDLLDMTRIASGKLRVTIKPTDLKAIVQAAADGVRPMARSKRLTLNLTLQDLDPIAVDPGRIEQVVWNLLTNAVKFTPEGGSIQADLRRLGQWIQLTVTDTGQGVAPAFLPRMFLPFAQAEEGPGRARTGLGLGLSITKSLVELHDGTITATSPGEGKGTTFTVRIPARPAPGGAGDTGDHAARERALAGIGVLVVEDHGDAMRAVRVALQGAGARVTGMTSSLDALRDFQRLAPALIISDLSIPDMNGLELMKRIRDLESQHGLPRAPAIALTAMVTRSDRDAAAASGYDLFLAKPVEPEALIAKAGELLERTRPTVKVRAPTSRAVPSDPSDRKQP